MALEREKLPGTALEVFNQRLNEIRKLKFNLAMKKRKTKKEGKTERKKEVMKKRESILRRTAANWLLRLNEIRKLKLTVAMKER